MYNEPCLLGGVCPYNATDYKECEYFCNVITIQESEIEYWAALSEDMRDE